MVESEGIGFQDFTSETAISGVASVSGNVISISGDVAISGSVSLVGNYTYRSDRVLVITAASGGQALGSGLTTSGYNIQSVIIKNPETQISGTNNYGFVKYSGNTAPYVYIGGYSGDAPYPGGGFLCSGKGLPLAPGDIIKTSVVSLAHIYAASETSGNPLSYIVEMR